MAPQGSLRHTGISGLNRYAEIRRWLTDWRESLTAFFVEFLEDEGSLIERDGWRLRIDDAWSLSFVIVQGSRSVGTMRQCSITDAREHGRCGFCARRLWRP